MDDHPQSINISSIPVAGMGGVGLLAIALVMAIEFPLARLLVIAGVLGGAMMAAVLLCVHRRPARSSLGLR
jgi:hypothetical protein